MDRLPTLRRLDQTPGGRFLSLLDGEPVGVQRPVATSGRGLPQPVLRGTPPFRVSPQPQRPIMPLEQAAMAQSMARPRTSAPMTKLQQDLAMKMGLTGAAQQQPSGIMGMLPGVGTPGFAGLSAAAARGLQLSGYQDRPITTGQVLGEMMGAGMEAFREARAEQRPDIKVAGDRLFKVYPDGTTELIAGKLAKPAEVKSEGPRIRTQDGREIETVYDKYNNLYPAGAAMTEQNRISPDDFTVVSQYSEMDVARRTQGRDTLRQSEKAIKTIDRLASEIQKLGPSAFDRIKDEIITSLKSKDPDRFGSLSDEEIARQVAAGQLQALVGQARLSLFGPGVLTEAEAALARQVFVGGDVIENPEVALNNLWAIRQGFYEDYNEDVDYFNSFRGNKYNKYTGEGKFNWNQFIDNDGRVRLSPQQASGKNQSSRGQRTTASGVTYTIEG